MRADKVCEKYARTLATWREKVASFSDDEFTQPPAGGGWSMSQICSHVGTASEMFMRGVDACVRGEGQDMGFRFFPAVMSMIGSLPPGRFKVPPDLPPELNINEAPEPVSRQQARELLDEMEKRMRDLSETVAGASARKRVKHPAAGWLNAGQWYQFAEMHTRHHLRQVGRLERTLRA